MDNIIPKKVSKNIYKGGKITDLRDIIRLSYERKSLIVNIGGKLYVKAAAWICHWSLAKLNKTELYYSFKEVDFENKY